MHRNIADNNGWKSQQCFFFPFRNEVTQAKVWGKLVLTGFYFVKWHLAAEIMMINIDRYLERHTISPQAYFKVIFLPFMEAHIIQPEFKTKTNNHSKCNLLLFTCHQKAFINMFEKSIWCKVFIVQCPYSHIKSNWHSQKSKGRRQSKIIAF